MKKTTKRTYRKEMLGAMSQEYNDWLSDPRNCWCWCLTMPGADWDRCACALFRDGDAWAKAAAAQIAGRTMRDERVKDDLSTDQRVLLGEECAERVRRWAHREGVPLSDEFAR